VRANGGITSEFSFTIGLHQGSTLSSCLLALVIGELARPIQDEAPWCMFFFGKRYNFSGSNKMWSQHQI